ncbi:helicase [Pantoea phage Phynn]|nr:helicase [Pantoea phage Phynn]
MDIEVKFLNTSHVQIQADPSIVYELRDYFSFQPPGYQYQPKYKYGGWNGFIYLMDYNGKLPYGLAYLVRKFAESRGYSVWTDPKIHEKEDITRADFDTWLKEHPVYSGNNQIDPHWYQADSVFEGIKERRAVLNLPTSAGKSLIQGLLSRWILEHYSGKVLIIVPTTGLVTQMTDDFVDYRLFPREMIHGIQAKTSKNNDRAKIYVSTWQSAAKMPYEWFQQFVCLMVDECHLSTGQSITGIINSMDQCIFKYGLSGSLKEGKANMMQYVGAFGKIFKPVNTARLMEEGQVTNLRINTVFMRYQEDEIKKLKGADYQTEIAYVTTHQRRNDWVCRLALKLAKEKQENTFIMFKTIKHGKWLYEKLSKHHDNVVYISGETKIEDRDAMKKIAESSSGLIVVGSIGVLSTGISIKNLHHIIFAHPCKSAVIVKQSIGRVLRKHASKMLATVWDLVDDLATKSKKDPNKYSSKNYGIKHAQERIRIYGEERFDYVIKQVNV